MTTNKVIDTSPLNDPKTDIEEEDPIKATTALLKRTMVNGVNPANSCAVNNEDLIRQSNEEARKNWCKLLIVAIICLLFMFGEVVGGYIAGSLAIMTDAAHMFSDVAGFMISYFAIYLGGKPSNNSLSFGYARAEILGALASILLIWGLCIWLFIEAVNRVIELPDVDGEVMLITAAVGLVCNFVNIFTLHSCGGSHHGHSHGEEHHAEDHMNEQERKLSHCH